MKRFNQEQKIVARQYIDDLLKEHNISANITKSGKAGCAYYYNEDKQPKIKIPKPTKPVNLGMGFHEIGHVVLGHCKMKNDKLIDKRPSYIHEYEAEQYSINKLKETGFYNKQYEINAIRYILENIAQAVNRRHPINKVPKEIIEWTGLKINTWKRAKKIFVPRGQRVKSKRNITIKFLLHGESVYRNKLNK